MSYQLLSSLEIISHLLYEKNFIILDKVHSTNQYLIDNISYLQSGFVCLAECQTHGRGRYGKYWLSPISNNVYLSIYWSFLCNNRQSKSISVLSLVISVVVAEYLKGLGVKGITLKWPNDIYFMGRKLVGILVEVIPNFYDCLHVVIGIGINMTTIFGPLIDKVHRIISLEEIGIVIDRNIFIGGMINILYQSLVEFGSFGFSSFFTRWLSLDGCYNRLVKVLIGNQTVVGISRGIDYNGSLLLERSGLVYSYSSIKEISLCYY